MKKVTQMKAIDTYISEDGMIFSDEDACKRWEQDREDYQIIKNLHYMKFPVPILTDVGILYPQWYLIQNASERSAIIRKQCNYAQYCYINGQSSGKESDISLGDWVIFTHDIQDEEDRGGVYTLSYILENFKKFVENISAITVDGKY
jgi:hypothetical protein